MDEHQYEGHKVLIKNIEDGRMLAETVVRRYEPRTMSIFLRPNDLMERGNFNVLVAILVEDGLSEFKGRMRGAVRDNEVEVVLAEYKHVNNRGSQRYAITADGTITHFVAADVPVQLNKVIEVHSINMSAGGILISAEAGTFLVGQAFRMLISIGAGNQVYMTCKVVRIQNSGNITEEYGCTIQDMWKAQ